MGICASLCCSDEKLSTKNISSTNIPNIFAFDPSFNNSRNDECIICLNTIKSNHLKSNNCHYNNCKLNAHEYCIYTWFLQKGSCPICHSSWNSPPGSYLQECNYDIEPISFRSRSISDPGSPPTLASIYQMRNNMQKNKIT